MEILRRLDKDKEAIALGEAFFEKHPALPLGISLARLYADSPPHRARLDSMFSFVLEDTPVSQGEAVLIAEAARLLDEYGRANPALALYQHLLDESGLNDAYLIPWLREAATFARRQDSLKLAYQWETRINRHERAQAARAAEKEE